MDVRKIAPTFPGLPGAPASQGGDRVKTEGASFREVLDRLTDSPDLKFSRHARERLQERNILLGKAELDRLYRGVERAATKGARDSLLLLDDLALVVSIKNKTVVTAVDGPHLKENVFTNIDSAVIV